MAAEGQGADDLGVNFALDSDDGDSSDGGSASEVEFVTAAPGHEDSGGDSDEEPGMTLFSGTARKKARLQHEAKEAEQESRVVEAPATAAAAAAATDEPAQDQPKKTKKPVSEAKKEKLRKLKEKAKAKKAARAAEKEAATGARAVANKSTHEQADELWDFILKHKTVHLSDLELDALKLKAKHIQPVHDNVRVSSTEDDAGGKKTGSRKHKVDAGGVKWPSAMKAVVPGWKALVAAGGKPKGGGKRGGTKRARGSDEAPPATEAEATAVPHGAPFVVVASTSARRAVAVRHCLVPLHWKVAKLFAKHMKVTEQGEGLAASVWHAGVGTPSRISTLIEGGYLLPDRMVTLILDTAPNSKGYDILTLKETQADVADLLARHILPLTATGRAKIALV